MESFDTMFGSAVGALKRDAAIGQRRAHEDDGTAVPRQHTAECRHGTVDLAQIGDFGHALEFLGGDLLDGGEDTDHGIVDPHVDGAEYIFRLFGRCLDLSGIRHVRGYDQGMAAECFYFDLCSFQLFLTSREECDPGAFPCKCMCCRAPYPAGGAGNHDDLVPVIVFHR